MTHARRRLVAAGMAVLTGLSGLAVAAPPSAQGAPARKPDGARYDTTTATSTGYGGAVTSVDPEATKVGVGVLRKGDTSLIEGLETYGLIAFKAALPSFLEHPLLARVVPPRPPREKPPLDPKRFSREIQHV